jgi:hypothetical protein
MPFPEITDKDFSLGGTKNQGVRDILDYAVMQWESRYERRKRLEKLYNSHNGIIDQAEIEAITKMTGQKSKTKYVKYRLGRSKLKQLHGEFLEISISPTVSTTNRDARNRKMDKYTQILGMALAKPQLDQVRSLGYDVYSGMKLPDINDKSTWGINNFKLENEIAMQAIVEDKMVNEKLKVQFYLNFCDLTIAAEVFGKNERTIDGVDTYRAIPPKYAMFEENVNDLFLTRSPYFGEVRYMYYHEIMSNPEFSLDDDQKRELKNIKDGFNSQDEKEGAIEMMDGHPALPVYTIQWKGLELVVCKTSPAKNSDVPYKRTLSMEYYNENKKTLEKEDNIHFALTGEHLLEKRYREVLWTAARIHKGIYTKAKKEDYIIQRLNDNGIYRTEFDYTAMLFNTVNGFRVSVQEIIYELERIYDDIRFMMNKEIRKLRGDTLIYDDAFLPKNKRFIDIIHSISEDGVVRYNSSAEGNRSGIESDSNKVGIGSINLGESQSLMVLLNQAMDIERVMDRITGMNDNRQGTTKATMTATANVNNIEASRSMTYDLFYFITGYIERVLMKLAEKTKLNETYLGLDGRKFILDEDQITYLVSTKNLVWDNYGVSVTDGKKERDILMKLEGLFPAEINASEIRTKDVAKFYMETNFAAAIKILDKAHEEIARVRQDQERVSQETQQNQTKTNVEMAREDREDRQNHDKEMEVLRTEGKKEIQSLKDGMKATMDFQNNIAKASIQKQKTSVTNPFEV